MPYTPRARREAVREGGALVQPGDLAYAVAELIEDYRQFHGDSFQTFAEVDGAVNSALREFKRRVVDPYEDAKLVEHGPVFGTAHEEPKR